LLAGTQVDVEAIAASGITDIWRSVADHGRKPRPLHHHPLSCQLHGPIQHSFLVGTAFDQLL
jgi:hypothetical protein